MGSLQTVAFGAASDGSQGDTTRAAFTKANSNVAVLQSQSTLTSFPTTIISASSLTAAQHLGQRVNVNLATSGTIQLPAAASCGADGVILLRNLGTVAVTLAITEGSGDTIGMTTLNGLESALFDTDGIHAWNVLMRGRGTSANETVNGNSIVVGNGTVGGTLGVNGNTTLGGTLAVTGSIGTNGSMTAPATLSYAPTSSNTPGVLSISPSGTNTVGQLIAYGKSDTTNASSVAMYVSGATTILATGKTGTGISNPLDIYPNTVFSARFYTGGGLGIGAGFTTPLFNGAVHISSTPAQLYLNNPSAFATASAGYWSVGPNTANNFVVFSQGTTGCYIVGGATAWAGQSDGRLKNIRSEITGAVAAINGIRTVRYSWKAEDDHAEALGVENDSRVYVGVIAQDVQKYVPEAVSVSHDDYLGVAYTDLVPLCMAAIKELHARIAVLEARP